MKINNKIVQQANNILRHSNQRINIKQNLNYILKNNKTLNFFVTVHSISVEHVNGKINPIIIFDNIQISRFNWKIPIITKYSIKFNHLRQLERGDILKIRANVIDNQNYLILSNIKSVNYVNYPEDFVLRRIVPNDKEIKIGFALVILYPPLTLKDGQIEMNYPLKERKAIDAYLKWLKRK